MADIKITDLTAYTSPASTDVLPIVDVGADITKKVSIADLMENAGAGSAAAPSIAFDGDSDTGIYRPTANELGISTAGTERLRIDSSGNTGLGTSSPAKPLHVYQAASGAVVRVETGGTDSTIQFRDTSTGGNFPQMGGVGNDLKFVTSTSERMRVDSAGRVLIGLSSSSAEASLILEGSSAAGTADAVLWINRGATPSTTVAGAELGKIKFGDINQNVATEIEGERDGGTWTSGVSHPGRLLFKTTADGAATSTERMRITSDGLFGIGTSGPVAKVDIRVANDPTVQANVLIVRATGTPSYAAAMGATSTGGAFIARGNASVQGQIQFATTDGSYTNYSERMRIDSAGRVGIGISSPDTNTSLDVDGRVQSSQDFVATTRSTNGGVADFILLTSASGGSPLGARIRHDGATDILSISNDPGTSTQHLLIRGNGVLNYVSCPTYADDTAAGTGGLVAGDIYKTSTGELRIKL